MIDLMPATIRLPWRLQRRLEAASTTLLQPAEGRRIDFTRPDGEEALVPPNSVSWRIFKNPISLFVGGVAAVILELAEPSVRTGVWEHSTFRTDPLGRLRRTGLAAMVTVYGARSVAEPLIGRIVRTHSRVAGETPRGLAYAANDPALLAWVHATAAFGFGEAYSRYVEPLSACEVDTLYREGAPTSRLYGATDVPTSRAALDGLFDAMHDRLEYSPIVFRFLDIMRDTPAFPAPLISMQKLLVRAAVDMLPERARACLGLTASHGLRWHERAVVKLAGTLADRIVLKESPAAQSCLRLGLPITHLYAGHRNDR